jgi:hypothetical protein
MRSGCHPVVYGGERKDDICKKTDVKKPKETTILEHLGRNHCCIQFVYSFCPTRIQRVRIYSFLEAHGLGILQVEGCDQKGKNSKR